MLQMEAGMETKFNLQKFNIPSLDPRCCGHATPRAYVARLAGAIKDFTTVMIC